MKKTPLGTHNTQEQTADSFLRRRSAGSELGSLGVGEGESALTWCCDNRIRGLKFSFWEVIHQTSTGISPDLAIPSLPTVGTRTPVPLVRAVRT